MGHSAWGPQNAGGYGFPGSPAALLLSTQSKHSMSRATKRTAQSSCALNAACLSFLDCLPIILGPLSIILRPPAQNGPMGSSR